MLAFMRGWTLYVMVLLKRIIVLVLTL